MIKPTTIESYTQRVEMKRQSTIGCIPEMDLSSIKHAISKSGPDAGRILSSIIISSYKGHPTNLKDISSLDLGNLSVVLSVLTYRHRANWDDEIFYQAYLFAEEFVTSKKKM